MKKLLTPAILGALLWGGSVASAAEYKASSSTSAGQGNLSQSISVSGSQPVSRTKDPGDLNWNAAYTYSQIPVGETENKTNSIELTVGYQKDWDIGAGINFSDTAAENLKSFGPEAWLGYTFKLGHEHKDGFRPSIETKVSYHGQQFTQSFTGSKIVRLGSRRTEVVPTSGTEGIRQSELTLEFDLAPLHWFSAHISGSKYYYNRDVGRFLGLLDTPRAIRTGATSFSETLGGFPISGAELGVSFFPIETWALNLDATRTQVATDGSISKGAKIELQKDITKRFKAGVGFDHEISENEGQVNLTMLDLTLAF